MKWLVGLRKALVLVPKNVSTRNTLGVCFPCIRGKESMVGQAS